MGLIHCGLRRHAEDGGDVEIRRRGCHEIGIVERIWRGEERHDVRFWLSHRAG